MMPTRIITFSAAIRYRKVPETPVPTRPATLCSPEWSFATWPFSARTPIANRNDSANTIVEWPSEKKKPTLMGRSPSAMSLRVVLSMAEM